MDVNTQKPPETKLAPQAPGQLIPYLAEFQQLASVLQALKGLGSASEAAKDENPRISDAEWAQLVVDALVKRLHRRVPLPASTKLSRPAEHCPFTGLNHSQIYEGMEPHQDGRPRIKSVSLAEPGEASGARFYSVQSALEYMDYLAERQANADQKDQGAS